MKRVGWDRMSVHSILAGLLATRCAFRLRRLGDRLLSPRRLVATTLAAIFFVVYLLNGVLILSAREAADPERLRLWLSGGMVIYAVYHAVRCAWSRNTSDLELTEAEKLWLGGAPVERSSVAVYHVGGMVVPAALKTLLLAVVLSRDVAHLELLLIGVFSSLVLLEVVRLVIVRWSDGLSETQRRRFRVIATSAGVAVALQIVARLLASTPAGSATWVYLLNSFHAIGETAASQTVQWLSIPWIPSAQLVVTEQYRLITLAQVAAAIAVLPLAILTLIRVDDLTGNRQRTLERTRLAEERFQAPEMPVDTSTGGSHGFRVWGDSVWPSWSQDSIAVIARQWVSVRRYAGTILFSFAVPTLLCLSPLVTGQVREQWFYVVGGIALCTMLLAPPALRIDFRRDLRRMLLLRSLPVKPISMVVGQIALPVVITCVFQWLTIAVAAAVTQPGWDTILLWTGMLNALAVFTFAAENALFLAYPHHERSEGVAMMIRAKLTFLGKACVIALAIGALAAWAMLCRGMLPAPFSEIAFVATSIVASWLLAVTALFAATWCWYRFDAGLDIPPQ